MNNSAITSADPNRKPRRLPPGDPMPPQRNAGQLSRLFFGSIGAILVSSLEISFLFAIDLVFIRKPQDLQAGLGFLFARLFLVIVGALVVPIGALLGAIAGAMWFAPWLVSSSREV
jgi:hypothetical protein